jgi:hypothetical protein
MWGWRKGETSAILAARAARRKAGFGFIIELKVLFTK